jgi:hypothetical protein
VSIKAGQILFSANNFVLARLQTAGPTNINIPLERIWEVGDYQSVATIRDIPDLQFDVDTFDVSVELESILCGSLTQANPYTNPPSQGSFFDFFNSLPIDIISPFRSSFNQYNIVQGVAIPHLNLDTVEYSFGVGKKNSDLKITLRGDSIYYVPGSPYIYTTTATGGQNSVTISNAPIPYTEHGITRYAYNVSVNGVRKFLNVDYNESSSGATPTGFTINFFQNLNNGDYVRVVYGSTVAATSLYPSTPVIESTSVVPGAVRGKDVDVYVQVPGATPSMQRWSGVQTATAQRKVTLQNDEEFGNYHYVAQDYNEANVTGTINVKSFNVQDLQSKLDQISNVSTNVTTGVYSSQPLQVEYRISNPDTGALIKTIYIPDARFTPPAISAKAKDKLTVDFKWESDAGRIYAYEGARPAGTNP